MAGKVTVSLAESNGIVTSVTCGLTACLETGISSSPRACIKYAFTFVSYFLLLRVTLKVYLHFGLHIMYIFAYDVVGRGF